jgi:hypothetical protein
LINALDVTGLDGVSIDGNGEVGDVSVVLFETVRTLSLSCSLITSDATLEVANGGPRFGLDGSGTEVSESFGLGNCCIESLLPDDVGISMGSIDSLLDSVGLTSEGLDELGFMGNTSGL